MVKVPDRQEPTLRKRAYKADLAKQYVFPDGTTVQWSSSLDKVAIIPPKGHGISSSHSSFGGVVFVQSLPMDEHGNPRYKK
jgi:hypothetical protein